MSITAINTSRMSLSEWLEHRKTGIGGSDAGAIMGVNKYVTPLDLYNDKLGLVEKDRQITRPYISGTSWRTLLRKVRQTHWRKGAPKKSDIQTKQNSWMIANIDRDIVGKKKLLECKTTSAYINSDEWGRKALIRCPITTLHRFPTIWP